jgi:hypothetical protein
VYGTTPDPALSATTQSGFTAADALTIALASTRAGGEAVGSYATTATAMGAAVSNYTVTYVPGAFSINPASSTTTVTSSKNPSSYGSAVSFTATLSSSLATGTVQFKIDGDNFGSPVTINGNGSAISISTSSLTLGNHTVSAVYSGDGNFLGSTSGPLTQVVASPVKITGGGALSPGIQFGFNVRPVQDDTSAKGFKGRLKFEDKGQKGSTDDRIFKSTSITDEYATDKHHGTFTGTGTLNRLSGHTFTVTLEDNGKRGAGNDKFRIQITDASNSVIYDSNAHAIDPDGTLTAGKLRIHYDKDDFTTSSLVGTTSSLQGIGSFLAGSLEFDIDVQTDGTGGFNAGAGVQFTDTDPNRDSFSLTSESITTMKVGAMVTVTGPAMYEVQGTVVPGVRFQTDWDTGKHTLHLRIWNSAGTQIYDSKPNQLTSGSCTFIASN